MADLATKSGISPPTRHGRAEASNDRTVRMPGVPARRASQNAAGVEPIGLRTPNPVNTARREFVAMAGSPGGVLGVSGRTGRTAAEPPLWLDASLVPPCG